MGLGALIAALPVTLLIAALGAKALARTETVDANARTTTAFLTVEYIVVSVLLLRLASVQSAKKSGFYARQVAMANRAAVVRPVLVASYSEVASCPTNSSAYKGLPMNRSAKR